MSSMKDWRGTPIEVGSTIVYPGRSGSSTWMNEAVVQDIGVSERYGREYPTLTVVATRRQGFRTVSAPKPVKLTAVARVTVVS